MSASVEADIDIYTDFLKQRHVTIEKDSRLLSVFLSLTSYSQAKILFDRSLAVELPMIVKAV